MIVDTSGLLAALFADQRDHERAREAFEGDDGPFVLSPFVLAELDYFVARWAGIDLEQQLLADVAAGAYLLAPFSGGDVAAAAEVIGRYPGLGLGLTDASLVVLADRFGIDRILTLDERHFRSISTAGGKPFRLLPADV